MVFAAVAPGNLECKNLRPVTPSEFLSGCLFEGMAPLVQAKSSECSFRIAPLSIRIRPNSWCLIHCVHSALCRVLSSFKSTTKRLLNACKRKGMWIGSFCSSLFTQHIDFTKITLMAEIWKNIRLSVFVLFAIA